ncbi:MAG: hypothetical protein OHK0013_01490 [Sandaracinaceae bacterium]
MAAIVSLAALVCAALPAAAQEAPQATRATPDGTGEPTPVTVEVAPSPLQDGAATTASPPEDMPAPIMVVVITSGRAPVELTEPLRNAIIEQVTPMTGGRPVLPLMADSLRDAIAACTEPACIGGHVAGAGAFGAILARVSRRTTRGPSELVLEMVDPVSGAPRLTPLTAQLTDVASIPATLRPLTAQLQGVMFSPPPPPPTLLVTVNVDGARVRIDEQDLGESPVARVTLRRGRHVVTVTRAGYVSARRTVELVDGQNERLDVVLAASDAVMGDDVVTGTGTTTSRGTEWYEEPLVWVGIGGGALVVAGVIVGVVVATSSSGPLPDPMGIPLPPID